MCYSTSCAASPSSPHSQDLLYKGVGFGLAKGTLTLGVSEAQFDQNSPAERETAINLASLAIIRAAKCETQHYKEKCTAYNSDCDLQSIVMCKAPSDMNIQMWSIDEQGHSSLHTMLHVQLKWDDKSTPFDCSVLDTPLGMLETLTEYEPEMEKATEFAGAVVAICKGISSLFNGGK